MSSERRRGASCVGHLVRSFARAVGSILVCGGSRRTTHSPGCSPSSRKHTSPHSSHLSLTSSTSSSSSSSLEEALFFAARHHRPPLHHQDHYDTGGDLYEPELASNQRNAMEKKVKVTEKELSYLNHKIEKLLVKLEEEYETEMASSPDEECVICISAKATMQTFPCGHRVVCRKCFVKTIQMVVSQRMLPLRCVICRAKVLRLKQTTTGGFPLGYIRSNSKQLERATLLATLKPSTCSATALPTASTPPSPLSAVFQAQRALAELLATTSGCSDNGENQETIGGTLAGNVGDEGSEVAEAEVIPSLVASSIVTPEHWTGVSQVEPSLEKSGATRPTSLLIGSGGQEMPVLLARHSPRPNDPCGRVPPLLVSHSPLLATPPHDWYSLYSRRARSQLTRHQQCGRNGPSGLAQQVQLATPTSDTIVPEQPLVSSHYQTEKQLEQQWFWKSSSSFSVGSLLPLLPIEEEESLDSEASPARRLPYQSICSSSHFQHSKSPPHAKLHKARSESSLGGYQIIEDSASRPKYQSVIKRSHKRVSGLRSKASSLTSLIHDSLSRMFHSRTFTALNSK